VKQWFRNFSELERSLNFRGREWRVKRCRAGLSLQLRI